MKFTQERIALIIIIFCISIPSFAQKNFQPGYVLKLNGDTLKGFVDYRNWGVNPKKIVFKGTDESLSEFNAIQIKGFGVADEKYVGAIIKCENPVSINAYNPDINWKTDTVFLQTIISGTKSLYDYVPSAGRELFYIGSDSVPTLLVYKTYFKTIRGLSVEVENKKFIGQLMVYFSDCPEIQQTLSRREYKKKKLEKLFAEYYEKCKPTEIKFHKKTERVETEFGFFGGASITSLKFSGGYGYDFLTGTKYSNSTDASFGMALDLILPRNNQKWSIRNELQYASYTCSGNSKTVAYGAWQYSFTSIGFSQLKINFLGKYKLNGGKVSPFVDFGISNAFALDYTNYKEQQPNFTGSSIALEGLRKFQQGVLLGGGIGVRGFSVECRFEGDYFSICDYTVGTAIKRFYFLIGYQIPHRKKE